MRDPALPPRSAASRYPGPLIGEEAHLRFSAAYLGVCIYCTNLAGTTDMRRDKIRRGPSYMITNLIS